MTELAQKGFSYHSDMNRIAPQKKLVTLIESDEKIGELVNDYVKERATPRTSKLEDFETEEAWLEDNLTKREDAKKFTNTSESTPQQEIIGFFMEKDPDHYEQVLTALGDHVGALSVNEYEVINSDMGKLEEFYDKVKEKVVNPSTGQVKPKATFRARSGGGAPPRVAKSSKNAWEMSSKDFDKIISKVKGY